jgi:serine/threonine protein kinase
METGKSFGKYNITKLIGSGATSDVYLAMDARLERWVALKLLKPALVSDQQGFARFTKEAQIAGKLFHDHIATVFDMGEEAGHYFIAMQYIDGISLAEYLKRKKALSWVEVQKLATQIGSALSYAHQEGFLHRDIKPNNIMVSEKGDFVLTDFGLTRAMVQTGMLTTTGAILGTPPYIPPEVWNGATATEASDQYSLACVIDEAITGKPRFAGETPQAVITKHLIGQPQCDNYPEGIPVNVHYIIQKAFSKQPQDRFPSMGAMIENIQNPNKFDVKGYLKGLPQSGGDKEIGKKRRKRSMAGILLGVLAVLIIFCGTGGFLAVRFNFFNLGDRLGFNGPIFKEAGQAAVLPSSEVDAEQAEALQPNPMQTDTLQPTLPTETNLPALTQTFTIPPTTTRTATATATARPTETTSSNEEEVVPLGSGVQIEMIENGTTGVVAYFLRGDGSAVENKYVYLYSQKQDLSGHWITDQRIERKTTDNAGSVTFDIGPGDYIVSADFDGYNWGDAHDVEGQANVSVESGKTTQLVLRLSSLEAGFVYADGNMVENRYVYLYTQQLDTSNQWVTDYRVDRKTTNNAGTVIFDVTPGNYIIACDFTGYNWGNAVDVMGEANLPLRSGQVFQLITQLGAVVFEAKDNSGNPIDGDYVYMYLQTYDINENPTADGSHIDRETTDNTGRVWFVVTPGLYVVRHGDNYYYNVEVFEGQTTVTNGVNVNFED